MHPPLCRDLPDFEPSVGDLYAIMDYRSTWVAPKYAVLLVIDCGPKLTDDGLRTESYVFTSIATETVNGSNIATEQWNRVGGMKSCWSDNVYLLAKGSDRNQDACL